VTEVHLAVPRTPAIEHCTARRLRVAVLCGGSYVSGMEIVALSVVGGLRKAGHDVTCLVNGWNDGEFIRRLEVQGVPYFPVYLGKISRSLRPRYLWWTANALAHLPVALIRLRSRLIAFKPDVVLAYNRDWLVLAANALKKERVVYHVQELADVTPWTQRIYRAVDRVTAVYAVLSEDVRQRLLQFGVRAEKALLVHNGVAWANENGRRRSPRPTRIGIVGQVGDWKGHDDLMEALRILGQDRLDFACSVFGTGDAGYLRSLRAKCASLGLADHVDFRGFVSDPEEIYGAMDICVVPSRFAEPFGLVAAEAGLRGIPVIATRQGGLPEIIKDGETGYLVEPSAPSEIADRIKRLIGDESLRDRLGAAARERVLMHFMQDRMISEIEKLCLRVAV
jgi:glycosyltransferase involved in cell wall biosynthesis